MGEAYSQFVSPETTPNFKEPSKFDSLYGFPDGRKEREMVATTQEMEAANLRPEHRDYCAHLLIDFYKCRHDKFPWVAGCKSVKEKWDHCEHDDFVLRMKEYERERRLMSRQLRKRAKESSEVLAD